MNTNRENPIVGKNFQKITAALLTLKYNIEFVPEFKIDIGNPPKAHKFDFVSIDGNIVVECKCYTWTKGQNNPSAKMSTLNEAVLFFKLMPDCYKKIIVMKKSVHPRRTETLADYYLRTYYFVLDRITLLEIDMDLRIIRVIKE